MIEQYIFHLSSSLPELFIDFYDFHPTRSGNIVRNIGNIYKDK